MNNNDNFQNRDIGLDGVFKLSNSLNYYLKTNLNARLKQFSNSAWIEALSDLLIEDDYNYEDIYYQPLGLSMADMPVLTEEISTNSLSETQQRGYYLRPKSNKSGTECLTRGSILYQIKRNNEGFIDSDDYTSLILYYNNEGQDNLNGPIKTEGYCLEGTLVHIIDYSKDNLVEREIEGPGLAISDHI